MTGKVIDLLTEFDEMGYIPTTFTENAEQAAIDWKNRLVAAIEAENAGLREQIINVFSDKLLERTSKTIAGEYGRGFSNCLKIVEEIIEEMKEEARNG